MTSKFLFVEGNQFLQLSALRFMMSPNYLLASEAAKGNVCRMLRQTQKDFAAFSKLYCQHTHTTTLGLKNQAKSPETASKQGRKKSNKYGKRRRSSSKNQMLDQPLVLVVLGGLQIEFQLAVAANCLQNFLSHLLTFHLLVIPIFLTSLKGIT